MFVLVGTAVIVVVADDGDVIVDVPLTNVHTPVPEDGALPANVKVALLHKA